MTSASMEKPESHRPWVIVHNAVSADSRIDCFQADIGKYYGLAAGMNADVVLTGSGTMCAAHPP
jgi:riboflavin biosynthesis pyrimidine reductase